jgi:hypothetical protein
MWEGQSDAIRAMGKARAFRLSHGGLVGKGAIIQYEVAFVLFTAATQETLELP